MKVCSVPFASFLYISNPQRDNSEVHLTPYKQNILDVKKNKE